MGKTWGVLGLLLGLWGCGSDEYNTTIVYVWLEAGTDAADGALDAKADAVHEQPADPLRECTPPDPCPELQALIDAKFGAEGWIDAGWQISAWCVPDVNKGHVCSFLCDEIVQNELKLIEPYVMFCTKLGGQCVADPGMRTKCRSKY
jgi:hypothetical protein